MLLVCKIRSNNKFQIIIMGFALLASSSCVALVISFCIVFASFCNYPTHGCISRTFSANFMAGAFSLV